MTHLGKYTRWAALLAGSILIQTGCAGYAEPDETDDSAEVERSESALGDACANATGGAETFDCSACTKQADNQWRQTCVSVECNLYSVACSPPIVSCGGSCTYRPFAGYMELCTRADGTPAWQKCSPPRLVDRRNIEYGLPVLR